MLLAASTLAAAAAPAAVATDADALGPPVVGEALDLRAVRRIAMERRAEVQASIARAAAARERPAIVSALEDPMVSPSLDHYPDEAMMVEEGAEPGPRYDWSLSIEQRFPLSDQLSQRRRGAEFEAERLDADAERVRLEVAQQAEQAFFMLRERRRLRALGGEQLALARQLVEAAAARYAAATGVQAEVLRAEVEVARAQARLAALAADEQATGAMLNASLGRDPQDPLPALRTPALDALPPPAAVVRARALQHRPELRGGEAEIGRSGAEVGVMRSMYWPMGTLKVGRAETMAEGPGTMAMLGLSLPIWTRKLRAGVAEAEAMAEMARAEVAAMRRMIEVDAIAAREGVLAARAQFVALRDDVVPRARMAVSPALAAYAAGLGPLAPVLDAAQALRMAQTDEVMSESALGIAWARLRRATAAGEDFDE